MSAPLTVLFWLWRSPTFKLRDEYTPERINVAARMIARNLSLPHRFVCATDWPPDSGFDANINVIPLWDDWREIKKISEHWGEHKPQCYVRLNCFKAGMRDILGDRFVSMDLDFLVLSSVDSVFSRMEDFLIYHRHFPNPDNPKKRTNPYNGSMYMMTAGAREKVWTEFRGAESIVRTKDRIGTDQAWIAEILGPNEAGWTIEDGVADWNHVKAHNNGEYEHKVPPGISLIFFPGEEKPWHYLPEVRAAPLPANHRDSRRRNRVFNQPPRFPWIAEYYK